MTDISKANKKREQGMLNGMPQHIELLLHHTPQATNLSISSANLNLPSNKINQLPSVQTLTTSRTRNSSLLWILVVGITRVPTIVHIWVLGRLSSIPTICIVTLLIPVVSATIPLRLLRLFV